MPEMNLKKTYFSTIMAHALDVFNRVLPDVSSCKELVEFFSLRFFKNQLWFVSLQTIWPLQRFQTLFLDIQIFYQVWGFYTTSIRAILRVFFLLNLRLFIS